MTVQNTRKMQAMIMIACAAWLATATLVFAQQWSEGFETGLGSAKTYLPDDGTTLAIGTNQPAEGKQYIRAVLPGKQTLEGLNVTATGLTGARVAKVTAKVRGKGELWLSLISRSGWLHTSESAAVLSDQWQAVSLGKTLIKDDTGLVIYFLSLKNAQPGAVFEVDDIQVKLEPSPQVYDAEVAPWRFEAEDFPMHDHYVAVAAEASGGKALHANAYLAMTGLPFPRTSKPVTVYLRVKPASVNEKWHIDIRQSGVGEYISVVQPKKAGAWQWLAFPPLTAGEIGDTFNVCCLGDKNVADASFLDQVVLSTRGNLTDAELAGAQPWCARRPLAVVARTTVPPTINGQGDDSCWSNAVACKGFLCMLDLKSAETDTHVRLCYDDTNLYLLWTCPEPILNVARQQRGEFRAAITNRDGEVYADDSAVILLDPANTGKQVFDFTVNALGTIADARCPGPNLWETRDANWNSGAHAKGNIGEDLWTVEMAIPFADLGGAPKAGDVWQTCFGRLAKARKETTSWNPSNRGFHDPIQLGSLVFGGATPGVALAMPDSLEPGKNKLAAALSPLAEHPMGVFLFSATGAAAARERSRTYSFTDLGDKPLDFSQTFNLRQEGDLLVEYGVLDAATLRPLYLTPILPRQVKSSVAQVKLACDGPYELHLNDEVISRGAQAKGEAIAASLRKGVNVFALKLEKGTAAIAVEAPGSRFTAESWKIMAVGTNETPRAALDDLAWPLANKTGDHPQLGPIVGEADKAVVLRRTLLWEKTRMWPTPEPAYYLARGNAQQISVITDGLPGKKLENWNTFFATPLDFEVAGSSGFYGNNADQPKFICTQLGTQQINGREMRVARVTADKPLLSGRHYVMSLFEVFVRYREEAGEPKSTEAEFLYWSEANSGNVSEPPQTIKVRLLPKLNGQQPKQLTLQLWGGWFSNMDDLVMREEILKCAQAAGFNDFVDHARWTSDTGKKYGLPLTLTINFQSWGMNLAPYLKEHPDERLITFENKPSDSLMCMTRLLDGSWPAVELALKKRMDEIRPGTVDIDYEYGPDDGPHSCYCPQCLAAFRDFAKLAPDVALDPRIIKDKYGDQWVDFMARRVAQMFAKFKEATHRLASGTKFSVYSGYQTPANPKMYGVNWQYIGDLQACDRAGAGYGNTEQDIARTVEVLKGIPLLPGLLLVPYDTKVTTPVTPLTRAGVLRLLLAGNGGALAYDRRSFDGRSWHAIADVSRLAAAFEEVFLKSKRSALPGFDITQAQIISEGRTTLVCVLNLGGKPSEYTIKLPAGAGAGEEFYSGKKVAEGEQIVCSLDPGAAAVYVLRR
ncbi:MAG: sugar-binding protein [Verrucomicrobiota bacterium]